MTPRPCPESPGDPPSPGPNPPAGGREPAGLLAATVAHDFNNILQTIRAEGEYLLRQSLPLEARECVRQILAAVDHGSTLARHLVAWSRREAGGPTPVALDQVARSLQPLLATVLGARASLEADLAPSGPVRVDPVGLKEVLLNLVINARTALASPGTVHLRTGVRALDHPHPAVGAEAPAGVYAFLEVEDTGPGVPPDLQQRIFEPFFTTRAREGGTGLGLSTVLHLVRASQGYVFVDNAPGARFTLLFPRVRGEGPRPLPRGGPLPQGAATILVVEDDEGVRNLAIRVLAREGYRVLHAAEAESARQVARLHEGSLDLALIDHGLPGTTGLEVARRLRRDRPALKVLLMSGHEDVLEEAGDDATGVLLKPFRLDCLLGAVRGLLGATAPAP